MRENTWLELLQHLAHDLVTVLGSQGNQDAAGSSLPLRLHLLWMMTHYGEDNDDDDDKVVWLYFLYDDDDDKVVWLYFLYDDDDDKVVWLYFLYEERLTAKGMMTTVRLIICKQGLHFLD